MSFSEFRDCLGVWMPLGLLLGGSSLVVAAVWYLHGFVVVKLLG